MAFHCCGALVGDEKALIDMILVSEQQAGKYWDQKSKYIGTIDDLRLHSFIIGNK